MVISQAMRNMNVHSSARVMSDTFVVSEKFISNCLKLFDEAMQLKAQKVEKHGYRCKYSSLLRADRIYDRELCFAGIQEQSSVFDH